jgi:two-component system, OmpR family, response regulator
MKILVIEDDPTVGEFVRRGLEEQRCQVDLVANGQDGEYMALSQPYDLVVLDMRLPGKNGLDILRTLRARGFERPVLVLTAQDAVDAKVETLRAGADDYVTKPFAFEELLARIEALLRRPRAMASPQLKVGDLELDQGTREVRRADELGRAHAQGVRGARVSHAARRARDEPDAHHGVRVGLSLRSRHQHRRRGDQSPPQEDRYAKHEKKLITTVRGVGYMIRG